MRQRIAKHEQTLRNPETRTATAWITRCKLFFTYLQYAIVHSFTLLFLHPSWSFVALHDPQPNGLWQRSYIEHVAYRNRVRFASASGLGVLVTAAVATFAIMLTVFPDAGVSPVYAATYTVNSNNDVNDGACDAAHCSLREAINAANANSGADTITFSIAMTVTPTSVLPQLSDNQTTINGLGKVAINGSSAGSNALGLDITGDNINILGLGIASYGGSGINIQATSDNVIIGGTTTDEANRIFSNGGVGINILGGAGHQIRQNFIGQQNDGAVAQNTQGGISINGGNNLQVGTTSGYNYVTDGITVNANASFVTFYGNVVGMSATGTYSNGFGVVLSGDSITFGGSDSGERNFVIASNQYGIRVDSAANGTVIEGNYIGIDPNGNLKGNTSSGIYLNNSTNSTINSNSIVNCGTYGIEVAAVNSGTLSITNNQVGVSPTSASEGGNGNNAIHISSTSVISVISGNTVGNSPTSGIILLNSPATITKNYIGMTSTGEYIPNEDNGVNLMGNVTGTVVGGSEADRNYIGGNGIGIITQSDMTGIPGISYNYIGLQPDGAGYAGNGIGILLFGQATITNNVISGNGGGNVQLIANGNVVNGNIIGLTAAGEAGVENQNQYGLNIIQGSSNNTIGTQGEPNVVAGNPTGQINVDEGSSGNTISYNYLNCNLTCTAVIDADSEALQLHGASSNTIQGNYMGGGDAGAIVFFDPGTTAPTSSNTFIGNFVGVGTDGSDISSDTPYGLAITESDTQTIGTIENGNTFTHLTTGVYVRGSQQVSIRGNIFEDNETNIELVDGANGGIQPPTITRVTLTQVRGTSQISGSIDVYQDGEYLGSTTSDGRWVLAGTFDIDVVTQAAITDTNGNTSTLVEYLDDTEAPVSSASPAGGTYSSTQTITLSATDNTDTDLQIYYTTDGSTPTTASTRYTSAITIAGDTTLQFFAIDVSDNQEAVNTEVYNISQDQATTLDGPNIGIVVNGEEVHPDCSTCTLRTNDSTPTFIGHVKKSLIDYIVRLVILAVSPDASDEALEKVFSKDKIIIEDPDNPNQGLWKITIPEQTALGLGEYIVKVGLRDPSGEIVKPMKKRLTIAVTPPAPVVVSPRALIYTDTPSFVGNAVNGTQVIARVFRDGSEVGHCQSDVQDSPTGTGSFVCSLPFDLAAGQYVARMNTQDPVTGFISAGSEVEFSVTRPTPVGDNVPLSLVPGEVSISGRYFTTDNTPVFIGLAPNGTEVVLVVDGVELFSTTLREDGSGTGNWRGTTSFLPDGQHSVYAIVRVDGEEISRTEMFNFRIVSPTVVPVITFPRDQSRVAVNQALTFTLLGHSNDTVTLKLSGPSTISVATRFSDDPSGTGRANFTFDTGLPRGLWTIHAVATDPSGKASEPSPEISVRSYIPAPAAPDTGTGEEIGTGTEPGTGIEVEPGTETETGTEPGTGTENGNTNEEVNENVNDNVNGGTNDNTNGFSNENANTGEVNLNVNSNENMNGGTNDNTNEVPGTAPETGEPLPSETQPFTFPEGIEDFPTIVKTPEDLTSDEEKAVKVVLDQYVKEQLQIIPAQKEKNSNIYYLVTEKNANDQPLLKVSKTVGLEQSADLTAAANQVLKIFGLGELKQIENVLIFRGTTIPYATVKLTIYSDPIVKIAQADADGRWTMTVPADTLPPGEHTAFLETAYGEVTSDEVEIARFVVVQQERLSNTTWLFLVNLGVVLIVLMAAILLQLRKRTQLLQAQQAKIPTQAPWKSGSVKLPESKDKKKPKGPDDLGDVMGVWSVNNSWLSWPAVYCWPHFWS